MTLSRKGKENITNKMIRKLAITGIIVGSGLGVAGAGARSIVTGAQELMRLRDGTHQLGNMDFLSGRQPTERIQTNPIGDSISNQFRLK